MLDLVVVTYGKEEGLFQVLLTMSQSADAVTP